MIPERAAELTLDRLSPRLLESADVMLIEVSLGAAWNEDLLNERERAAAARRKGRVRERWVAARSALRAILGGLLDSDPRSLEFSRGAHGKPYLPTAGLTFNQSDSADLALLGVRRIAERAAHDMSELGVDIEHLRDWDDLPDIAALSLTQFERDWLEALDRGEQRRAFFRLWTAKEAFLKATGEGLSRPLTDFSVVLDGTAHIREHCFPEGKPGSGAYVYEIPGTESFCASVCSFAPIERWSHWRLLR